MTKTILIVSAVAVSLTSAGVGVCYSGLVPCHHDGVASAATSASGLLDPGEPVHMMFKGCQSSCGSRSNEDRAQAHAQPAALGEITFCPVSGAVFRVSDKSTRRVVGGKTLYFCCDACAGYFDSNQADVLQKRGFQG